MPKYSCHAFRSSASCCSTRPVTRCTSRAANPRLVASRTGTNQNFASFRSRATCTCGGSARSLEKKKNRYGPLSRMVGLTWADLASFRVELPPGSLLRLTLYRQKGPFLETAAGAAHEPASPAYHCPHCARPWHPEQASRTQQLRAACSARTRQLVPVPFCALGGFRWRAAKHRNRQPSLPPQQPTLPAGTPPGAVPAKNQRIPTGSVLERALPHGGAR
jgi:hypothetical protein